MSLSNDSVLTVLKNQFVCGYRNITGEPYAGKSGKHETDGQAIVTTNGAGPHNVQFFFLSEEGDTFVVKPGDTYEEVAKNSLGELAFASPAVTRDGLFIRTQTRLYRIR